MFEQEYLPYCLSIGISEENFWKLTFRKLKIHIKADNIRRENRNFECWLNGFYNYMAIGTALANGFSKNSKAEYLKQPIRLTPLTAEEKREKAEKEREKAIAFFNSMQAQWDAKHEAESKPN